MGLTIALSASAASLRSRVRLVLCSAAGRALFAARGVLSAAAIATLAGAHARLCVFSFATRHLAIGIFAVAAEHFAAGVFALAARHILTVFGHLVAAGTRGGAGAGGVLVGSRWIGCPGPHRCRQGQNQSKHFDLHICLQNQICVASGLRPLLTTRLFVAIDESENLDPEDGAPIEPSAGGEGFGFRSCGRFVWNERAEFRCMNQLAVSLAIRSGRKGRKFCRGAHHAATMVRPTRQAGQRWDDGHHLITFQLRAAMTVAVFSGSYRCGGWHCGYRQLDDPRQQRNRHNQRNES